MGYRITFNSTDWWSFDNETAKHVVIFGADNGSSSHAYNLKNNFLILGKGPNFEINRSFGSPEEKKLFYWGKHKFLFEFAF